MNKFSKSSFTQKKCGDKSSSTNKSRTNLLLLVDKELKSKNNFVKINSLSQKQFINKNNENIVIELNESFSKNSHSSYNNCFQTTKTNINNSLNLCKVKTQNSSLLSNRSLSNLSVKSSNSSKMTYHDSNSFTNGFPSPLLNRNNFCILKRDINFFKNEREKIEELIFTSFKKLKKLSENLKFSRSISPNNNSKINSSLLSKKSLDLAKSLHNKSHLNFQIRLKSMSTLETEELEEKILYVNRNLDFSFDEM